MRLRAKKIRTGYWRPGQDYVKAISGSLTRLLKDGDVIVVSEKAISTAEGNLIDESRVKPGVMARLIAQVWMRYVWGYILGRVCHLKPEAIKHLRSYPTKEGAAHKQVVLRLSGLLQALKHGSEGGVDISNVPYAYACLPLRDPQGVAEKILSGIRKGTGRNVMVVIADTDSTFSLGGVHFTTRPDPIEGILSLGGVVAFVLGRAFRLRQRATPLAVAGSPMSVEEALDLAEFAHHVRGYGAGRTVWDVAERFGVGLSEVTWEMLEMVEHYPIVLIRRG
ncbi:MAG: coenzyme F420-0:L-glutamate ligase [Candidatus Bathyarchaeia archaeon]